MAKTYRIDTVKYVPGRYHVGNRGLGVLAETIPPVGTHGPSAYYPSLDFPADNGKEVRGLVLTVPSSGVFTMEEDGTCSLVGASDGVHVATIAMYLAGEYKGVVSVYFYINASSAVISDLDSTYNVIGKVQADLDSSYSIIGKVQSDLDVAYAIIGKVSSDLDSEYLILNETTVITDLDSSYSVLGKVQSDLDASYAVRGAVTTDLDAAYAILQAVTQDLDGSYNIHGAVQSDLDAEYAVIGKVVSDLDASYQIQGESGPCPTAEEIAEAVWSRMLTGSRIPGSAGSMLQDTTNRVAATL